MNSESREQLLSAYLDGELSADERAQVEAWLAADPAYRVLRDDLLSARAAIQSLPRHRLDHDLSAAVLRRAERAVLEGRADVRDQRAMPGSLVQRWLSSGRSWRMLVWPAAAVAAALLIAFLARDQQGERRVAIEAPRGASSIQASKDSTRPAAEGAKPQLARRADHDEAAPVPAQLAEPQAAAGAAAPMSSPVEAGRLAAKPMRSENEAAGPGSPAPREVVVLEVDREFVRRRALESWLDARKIAWRRLPQQSKPAAEVDEKLEEDARTKAMVADELEVQITGDELAGLKTEVARRRVSGLAVAADAPQLAGENRKPAKRAEDDNARRPLVIRLKVVATPPTDDGSTP